MPDDRRCDREHGLFVAADAICSLWLTTGFCTPKNCDNCSCWDKAEDAMQATGLSAQGIAYVISHRRQIEDAATKERQPK